jgi:hypothetical protein
VLDHNAFILSIAFANYDERSISSSKTSSRARRSGEGGGGLVRACERKERQNEKAPRVSECVSV